MDVARRDSGVQLPVTGLDLVAQPALGLDLVAVDDAERRVLVEVEPARAVYSCAIGSSTIFWRWGALDDRAVAEVFVEVVGV